MVLRLLGLLLVVFTAISFSFEPLSEQSKEWSAPESKSKYKVGDEVKCSQWGNDSYWKGTVVQIVKEKVYQVKISQVRVEGSLKLYLNPSECTGKKRLSYENGEGYYETKIWVHERCLD